MTIDSTHTWGCSPSLMDEVRVWVMNDMMDIPCIVHSDVDSSVLSLWTHCLNMIHSNMYRSMVNNTVNIRSCGTLNNHTGMTDCFAWRRNRCIERRWAQMRVWATTPTDRSSWCWWKRVRWTWLRANKQTNRCDGNDCRSEFESERSRRRRQHVLQCCMIDSEHQHKRVTRRKANLHSNPFENCSDGAICCASSIQTDHRSPARHCRPIACTFELLWVCPQQISPGPRSRRASNFYLFSEQPSPWVCAIVDVCAIVWHRKIEKYDWWSNMYENVTLLNCCADAKRGSYDHCSLCLHELVDVILSSWSAARCVSFFETTVVDAGFCLA